MRVALCIYICKYPCHLDTVEDEVENLLIELDEYHIDEYTKIICEMRPETTEASHSQPAELSLLSSSENLHEDGELNFSCGNPDAQTIHGTMHFFNDISKCGDDYRSDLICMLAVPTIFNLTDILSFLSSYTSSIIGIRIVRDRNPHNFMVLLRFVDMETAEEFYLYQHGQPYNLIDDTICQLAFVASIEFGETEVHDASLAAGPLIELPHCAVCLEKLDESTSGILTVLCNHSFHCECMRTCTTCPVCRLYAVPPEQTSHSCMVCGNTEGLWLCLICGYVGCGRYEGGHAHSHFERTNHTYSMDVDKRCVWDYIGDNYVHRLIQNKADGKIVAVQDQDGILEEKFESLTLEYTYLLTQQLESQREFFEKKLLFVEQEAMERIIIVEEEVQKITQEKGKYKARLEEREGELRKVEHRSEEERKKVEKKVDTLSTKLNALTKDLSEERALNKSLQANQREWIAKVVASNKSLAESQEKHAAETCDLREQIKDLMFHLQGQATINESPMKEEIMSGDVHVMQAGPSNEQKKRSPRKKK